MTTPHAPHVAVIGCGLAGIAAAETLIRQGVEVTVYDKGQNPGGRLAVRDLKLPSTPGAIEIVDIGAAYFTVSDDDFSARVFDWQERGLARAWFDTCTVVDDDGWRRAPGPTRFAATRGQRSLVADLVEVLQAVPRFHLRLDTAVEKLSLGNGIVDVDGYDYDAVLLAMPDAQASRIVGADAPESIRRTLATDAWQPVISHVMVFGERSWPDDDFWFTNNSATFASIADNGRRRGTGAPVLVAHSTPSFATEHAQASDLAASALTTGVCEILGIDERPAHTLTHRWGLAHPAAPRAEPYLWDADARIAVCGDGWHGKPRMEGAFLSGKAAALEVLAAIQ